MRIAATFLCFVLLLSSFLWQTDTTFYSLSAAKKDPVVVEYLILQKKKYTKLPDSLFVFENLLGLDLSKNKIDLLSDDVGNMPLLRELNLSKNKISLLPIQIGRLTELRELDLSMNQIKELPYEIGNLTNLKILRLSGNQFTELPSSIFNLIHLEEVDLRQLAIEEEQVNELRNQLPEAKIFYTKDCACGL